MTPEQTPIPAAGPDRFRGEEPQMIRPEDYLQSIGVEPDSARHAETVRNDSDSEVAAMEERLRELQHDLALDPRPELISEFEDLSSAYRSALMDRLDLPPRQ